MNLSAEFKKWGRTLVIENTDSTRTAPFKGFIQPLRYKNKMYLYGVNTEIGYNSQGYYLYIGPPEHDLTVNEDALIIDGDVKYQIDRAEKIKFGEDVLYVWAVVRTVVEITEYLKGSPGFSRRPDKEVFYEYDKCSSLADSQLAVRADETERDKIHN